jgi:hypothetical protein
MFFFKKNPNDDWKRKAKERRAENAKLKKRIDEIEKSRDDWKIKAQKLQTEKLNLIDELKKNS